MNPLASLPGTTSAPGSLNKLDAQKILRFLLVQIIGLFLSFVPVLLGFHYVWHMMDFTLVVVTVVNTLAETGRRYIAGS